MRTWALTGSAKSSDCSSKLHVPALLIGSAGVVSENAVGAPSARVHWNSSAASPAQMHCTFGLQRESEATATKRRLEPSSSLTLPPGCRVTLPPAWTRSESAGGEGVDGSPGAACAQAARAKTHDSIVVVNNGFIGRLR